MSNYEKQNFVSGQVLKAEHLNHMEDGIGQLSEEIADIKVVKVAEQPGFVNSTGEMTDTSKVYVNSDGYLYVYRESENYNLLNLNEVAYSSRLQDDIEGVTSSTGMNAVTGWIPVEYGKYYSFTFLYNGVRGTAFDGVGTMPALNRVNIRRADGTIVVYNKDSSEMEGFRAGTVYARAFTVPIEDAEAVRIHFASRNDNYPINTEELLRAYEPMIVEGSTANEAFLKSSTYEYVEGGTEGSERWVNTGLAYQPTDYEDRIIELEEDVEALQAGNGNSASVSPYFRDVNFGMIPSNYYQGMSASYEALGFGKTTQYADFINAWRTLIANHSTYVTEANLGAASDGQPIYMYNFSPARIANQKKPIPKVVIIAGQHGNEKSDVFGLYYFVENLLNKWTQHPALEYLRNHVNMMIIPVLNTYGFDNFVYKNANGVNTNRNYDANWVLLDDPDDSSYGGAAPFDQPETQIVRDLLITNTDALIVIDFHTFSNASVKEYSNVNWCALYPTKDNYYNRMQDAIAHHLSAITAHFNLDYELNEPGVMMGHMTKGAGTGNLRGWATINNFVGVLVEGFNGFPNEEAFSPRIFKANEEIIVNYLIAALNYLGK